MSKIRITKHQLRGLIREILEESLYEDSVISEWDSSVAQSAQDGQVWTNVPYSWRKYSPPPPTPQPKCLTCGDEEDEDEKNKKLLDEDELDAADANPGDGQSKDPGGAKNEADLDEIPHPRLGSQEAEQGTTFLGLDQKYLDALIGEEDDALDETDLDEDDIDEEVCVGNNCWNMATPMPYRKGLDTSDGPFKTPPPIE